MHHIRSTSINIQWLSPEPEELNGELAYFIVNVLEEDTNTSMDAISTSTQLNLESLHPFYVYLISVSAVTILPGPSTIGIRVKTLEDGMFVICTYMYILILT